MGSILDELWWKDWYLNHMADLDIQLGTVEDDRLLGLSEDDLLFGDLGADRIIANNGDDLIDGGAGSDIIFAGGGDDFVFHRISENIGSIDFANGAGGHDTLVIGMDESTFIDEATQALITADFMEVMGTGKKFDFDAYDLGFDFKLTVMNFEEIYFVAIAPPFQAVDDAVGIDARHATMIDVLANDTVLDPEDVVIVSVGLPDPDQGLVRIVDNKILFYPLAEDFDDLLVGQTRDVVIEYTIKDSLGHESTATLTVTVQGHAIDDGNVTTNQGEYNGAVFVGDLNYVTDNDTLEESYIITSGDVNDISTVVTVDECGDDLLVSSTANIYLIGDAFQNLGSISSAGHDVLTASGNSSFLVGDAFYNFGNVSSTGISNAGHDVLTASGNNSYLIGDVFFSSGNISSAGHDVLTTSGYFSILIGDVYQNVSAIENCGDDILTVLTDSNNYNYPVVIGDVLDNSSTIENCGDDILTVLTGASSNSFLIGDVNTNSGTIINCGDDILIGGKGSDEMYGDVNFNSNTVTNYGNDTFVFDLGSSIGNDIIHDFGNGNDILELHNVDLTDVLDAISGNVLDFGALVGTITLDGFTGTLQADEVDGNIIVSIL